MGIASVKEHDTITIFLNQFMYLFGLEVLTTTNHTSFIDTKLVFAVFEPDKFTPSFDTESWKIFSTAIV